MSHLKIRKCILTLNFWINLAGLLNLCNEILKQFMEKEYNKDRKQKSQQKRENGAQRGTQHLKEYGVQSGF